MGVLLGLHRADNNVMHCDKRSRYQVDMFEAVIIEGAGSANANQICGTFLRRFRIR